MGKSITSTNAVIVLVINGLYDTGQPLEQFSTDDIYDVDDVEPTETEMSLDGILSGGRVPVPVSQSFMLNASSRSCLIFDTWRNTQDQIGDVLTAEGRTILTSIGQRYVMTRGFLKSVSPIAKAGKTLKTRKFTVLWESVIASSL